MSIIFTAEHLLQFVNAENKYFINKCIKYTNNDYFLNTLLGMANAVILRKSTQLVSYHD